MMRRAIVWLPASMAIGVGLSTIATFMLLRAGVTQWQMVSTVAVAITVVVMFLVLRRAVIGRADEADGKRAARRPIYAALALALPIAGFAIANMASTTAVNAHGEWDAWAIWNQRARFLFRDTADWTRAFSPQLSHPDYPPMLPMAVTQGWMAIGREHVAVPIALAALFSMATAITLGASVGRERGAARGIASAAALLASPVFIVWTAAQQADVPLAFFILLTFVAMARGLEPASGRSWWLVSGASAGLAMWTKNEGVAFLAVAVLLLIAWRVLDRASRLPRHAVTMFAVGAAPALVAVALFKLTVLQSPNELASQPWSEAWRLSQQANRWRLIANAMGTELWRGGGTIVGVLPIVAAFTLVTGMDARGRGVAIAGIAAVVLLLAAYFAVYLTSPYDLEWHVRTSVGRLFLHVMPLAIWALFLLARRD